MRSLAAQRQDQVTANIGARHGRGQRLYRIGLGPGISEREGDLNRAEFGNFGVKHRAESGDVLNRQCRLEIDARSVNRLCHSSFYCEVIAGRAKLEIKQERFIVFQTKKRANISNDCQRQSVNSTGKFDRQRLAGMVGGQALDLLAEGRRLDSDELDRLHGMKTGALLTASLVIGGMAADASSTTLSALEAFGRGIGLAFQVTDDILDATEVAADLGKHPSDGLLDKSTYVALYGLEDATEKARKLAQEASDALRGAAIDAPELIALASYVVERKR